MKTHPYADLFPMMTAAELDALTADIAANGQRQPIIRYQGLVLDGRNRLLACEKAGVEPKFEEHEGDDAGALALVISLNVQRRDLTAAQRAIVAARALPMFEDQRRSGRPKNEGRTIPHSGKASNDAAKVFKVGEKAVQQAKAVLAEAPDLTEQVESCTLSLAAAYEQTQQRREQVKRKAKDAQRVAEYADAISSGDTTLEKALQEIVEREREEKEKLIGQADARRTWLKRYVELLEWVERFIGELGDDYLVWYSKPDSPGWFEHGVTAERVAAVIVQLERTRAITFAKGADVRQKPKDRETGRESHRS